VVAVLASAFLVTAELAFAGPAEAAVGWGINLDGPVNGDPPTFSYQQNPYFRELLGGASCNDSDAICYARIYVPWDAVNDGKGSFAAGTCQASASGPGTTDATFQAQLQAAAAAVGIGHVLVSVTTALPSSRDDIWPTDAEYECGLSGLERQAPGVVDWEVFNEPDSVYPPDSTATGGPDCTRRNGIWVGGSGVAYQCLLGSRGAGGNRHGGSAQAAAYWYLDAKRVDPNPGHTLIAGGFNYSSSRCTPTTCYYLRGYMRVLSQIYPHAPDAIALNPYIDVSYAALNGGNPVPPASSGLPSTQGAIVAIDRFFPAGPSIWFTESGVWLTDGGKEPVTSDCGDGNPQDAGSWEGCLNGNPLAQALAAEGYLRLPDESPQVKRVYYYDFDDQNPGWDSGLVNVSPRLAGRDGYGTPRTAWCVLRGFALGESPSTAETGAVTPGGSCDDEDPRDDNYEPVVDQAYLSDPLPVNAAAAAAAETPGEVGRDVVLTVAQQIRALAATL
jgi:hypothetical protein